MIKLETLAGKKSVFVKHFEEDFSFGHPTFISTVLTDIQIANRMITGDSDLVTPIRMVRTQLMKPVGVLNPQRLSGPNCRPVRQSAGLQHAASFYQNGVSWNQLINAQFPPSLTDSHGTFTKPAAW